jgi:AcrR family transcriptional regulator
MNQNSQKILSGRPRDNNAREAILKAAIEITIEGGFAALSLEAISSLSGASRPTLYRWWRSKGEILLEALLQATETAVSYNNHTSLLSDLQRHAMDYASLLNSDYGKVYRALFAEGLSDPTFMLLVRTRLIEPRRALTKARLEKAILNHELVAGLNLEALIDTLYAPFFYRLILEHGPIDEAFCVATINQALKGNINR